MVSLIDAFVYDTLEYQKRIVLFGDFCFEYIVFFFFFFLRYFILVLLVRSCFTEKTAGSTCAGSIVKCFLRRARPWITFMMHIRVGWRRCSGLWFKVRLMGRFLFLNNQQQWCSQIWSRITWVSSSRNFCTLICFLPHLASPILEFLRNFPPSWLLSLLFSTSKTRYHLLSLLIAWHGRSQLASVLIIYIPYVWQLFESFKNGPAKGKTERRKQIEDRVAARRGSSPPHAPSPRHPHAAVFTPEEVRR